MPELDDEELVDAFYDKILRLDTDLHELRTPARYLYSVCEIEDQVCNGGFVQYFWNTGGEFIQDAIEGLKAIGCSDLALLVERASNLHDQQEPAVRKAETEFRTTGHGDYEAFRVAQPQLESLDDEFYAGLEEVQSKLATYVRMHMADFE